MKYLKKLIKFIKKVNNNEYLKFNLETIDLNTIKPKIFSKFYFMNRNILEEEFDFLNKLIISLNINCIEIKLYLKNYDLTKNSNNEMILFNGYEINNTLESFNNEYMKIIISKKHDLKFIYSNGTITNEILEKLKSFLVKEFGKVDSCEFFDDVVTISFVKSKINNLVYQKFSSSGITIKKVKLYPIVIENFLISNQKN
jgi:hypothetical protein